MECALSQNTLLPLLMVQFVTKNALLLLLLDLAPIGILGLAALPLTLETRVQVLSPAHRQLEFMPKMEVHICYNSQKKQQQV